MQNQHGMMIFATVMLVLVSILLIYGICKEFRKAYKLDIEGNTSKHIKRLVIEYGIIIALSVGAYYFSHYVLRVTILSDIAERLYGVPVTTTPVITPSINPFFK